MIAEKQNYPIAGGNGFVVVGILAMFPLNWPNSQNFSLSQPNSEYGPPLAISIRDKNCGPKSNVIAFRDREAVGRRPRGGGKACLGLMRSKNCGP